MTFTSAVLLSNDDEKKNGKVGVTERFFTLFGELLELGSLSFSVKSMRTTKK